MIQTEDHANIHGKDDHYKARRKAEEEETYCKHPLILDF